MLRPSISNDELILIRHAPAANHGCLCGRTDVGIEAGPILGLEAMKSVLEGVGTVTSSPAIRCRATVEAIWPGRDVLEDQRFWEQNFGSWEGQPFDKLPDIGSLAGEDLINFAAPNGESFVEVCSRVRAGIDDLIGRPSIVVAHAGVVRAGLALAIGPINALKFEIAPLSITRLRRLKRNGWSIVAVNWCGC